MGTDTVIAATAPTVMVETMDMEAAKDMGATTAMVATTDTAETKDTEAILDMAAARAMAVARGTAATTVTAVTKVMALAIRDMASSRMADSQAVTTTRATVEGAKGTIRRRTVVRTEGTQNRITAGKAPDIHHDNSKNCLV